MEEISEFMYKVVESEQLTQNDLIVKISNEYKSELTHSDLTFVKIKYSEIILSLWERECEKFLDEIIEKISQKKISATVIEELLNVLGSENINEISSSRLNSNILKLIKREANIEHFRIACNNILNILITKLKSSNETMRNDLEFLEALVDFLRHSYPHYNKYVDDIFNLRDFVNGEISLHDIAMRLNELSCDHPYFNKVKIKAKYFEINSSILKDFIRQEIKNYIAELEISTETHNDISIVELKKKFLTSEEVIKNLNDANEIHVICDILHVSQDLTEEFQGKNVAIYANYIHIHTQSTWDISGIDSRATYTANAGRDEATGKGKDGSDGYAGESAGHFTIECKSIINPSNWTIISNGGNGSEAQNGGDGENGENGTDASEDDFTIHGDKIKIFTTEPNLGEIFKKNEIRIVSKLLKEFAYKRFEDGLFVKDLFYYVGAAGTRLLFLVKGSNGGNGRSGGHAGRGGEKKDIFVK